jgi:chromosome partitioning protein
MAETLMVNDRALGQIGGKREPQGSSLQDRETLRPPQAGEGSGHIASPSSAVLNPKPETDVCRIIAFANQKGGSGKTTCAVNVSCALANKGFRTLLIDIDPQSNATVALGVNPAQLPHSIHNVLTNHPGDKHGASHRDIGSIVLETQIPHLFLAPSTIELAGAEIELFHLLGRETILRESLVNAVKQFHYIIIDCPPALGLLTVNALVAASEVFIPVSLDFFALMGTRQLLDTIALIKERLNPALEVTGVIPTFYDSRTNLSKEALAKLYDFFPNKVFRTVIHNAVKLREAPGYGQPIALYDPHSRAADNYASLADEVIANANR